MTVSLNYDEAKRLVEAEIAKEGADYVYRTPNADGKGSCVNVVENKWGELVGSCLVGRALVAAGVDPHKMAGEHEDDDVDNLRARGVVKLTQKAQFFLSYAQARQDLGATWGVALDRAIRYVTTDGELYRSFDDEIYR